MLTVDEYISNASPEQQLEYKRIQAIVYGITPDATEVISYGIPTFKYKNKYLLYFGAFKNHMSVFPTPQPIEHLVDRLKDYKVSKGTVQFTHGKPLPNDVLVDMITLRKNTIDEL